MQYTYNNIYITSILLGRERKDGHSCIMYRNNTYLILRFSYTILEGTLYFQNIRTSLKYRNIEARYLRYFETVSQDRYLYCHKKKKLGGISTKPSMEFHIGRNGKSLPAFRDNLFDRCWSEMFILSSSELA